MSREDKILLITNGTFTVTALILLLYLPDNSLFYIPAYLRLLLYAPPAVCFFVFLKVRSHIKAALIVTWINCAVFAAAIALFTVAFWYRPPL